jgi:SAM-dependent methyltransferase
MRLARWLGEERLRGLDMESPERLRLHHLILREKPLLRSVFTEFYRTCLRLDRRFFAAAPGRRVEVGAGVSFFREIDPGALVTDLVPAAHLDAAADALRLPFGPGTLRALFGINCFHHFPDPERFFREAGRVLAPGGGVVLIEPFYGPLSAAVHRRLFATECFEPGAPEWSSGERRAMVGANQALSYVVFVRDRERFGRVAAGLRIVHRERLDTWGRYLASGGLNFRSLCPPRLAPVLRWVEQGLRPLNRLLALHHVIVLRRE